MKNTVRVRHTALIALLFALLTACAPQTRPENNVRPTLVSASAPQRDGELLVLQGRYFGDGRSGAPEGEGSYVLVGADANGEGGVRIEAETWSPARISLRVPTGAGYGYVFVMVDGVPSNGLPTNLP